MRTAIQVVAIFLSFVGVSSSPDVSGAASFPPVGSSTWVRVDTNPVLHGTEPWEQGCVCEPQVIWDTEAEMFVMYYRGGWGGLSGIGIRVGVATSTDGVNWIKHPSNPVYVGAQPYVFRDNDSGVWWLHTTNASLHTSVATSSDGLHWETIEADIPPPTKYPEVLWGNRVFWKEKDGEWKMLQEIAGSNGGQVLAEPWAIYLYTSTDGRRWSLRNFGWQLWTLRTHRGGMYGGPSIASVNGVVQPMHEGKYHIWYHSAQHPAPKAKGNLPTDIFHATSRDLVLWRHESVLEHSGSGFEYDQAADPSVLVALGKAWLYYDGDNNPNSTCAIGLATAPLPTYNLRAFRDRTEGSLDIPRAA